MAKNIVTNAVLKINGKEVENSFTAIGSVVRKLERDLKKLPIGSEEFIRKAAQVKEARSHFQNVKNEINAVSNSLYNSSGKISFLRRNLLSLGDTFRQVFTADLASRFFDTIVQKGKLTVDQLLQVADAMTDVQKTSGMSLAEVKELWDAMDEMDTRTSKLDRLKIAEVGGRLGVPAEEMKSFVQEVDKAYVALGDSFEGGLEGVVDQLGKIKGLFEDTKSLSYAEAINRVGSALNTLAAQGTASEGNISQFALRLGTLPESLRPSIANVLGLGAAFEESGIDAQIASSGFSNFITTAGKNIESFAYSMNISVNEAKELINTKPEEFFLRFAQGMKGLDATTTSQVLESLKLNTLEVQKAVGAAANRTDDFRKAMNTSAVEMEKMTSLQDEFNQKNNNAPAILEKIKNEFNDMFTSTNIINHFEWLVNILGWITGVSKEAGYEISTFRERLQFLGNIIKVVGTAILGYNASVLIATISTGNLTKITWLNVVADKAQAAGLLIKRIGLLAYNVVLGIVTLNTDRITIATIAFNTVTRASPWGVLITLVTTVVVAYKAFSKELDEVTRKQRMVNELSVTASEKVSDQRIELEKLIQIAKSESATNNQREEALRRLNAIIPDHIGLLTLQNIKTNEGVNIINKYIDALNKQAYAEAVNERRKELVKKQIELQGKDIKHDWRDLGGFVSWAESGVSGLKGNMTADEAKRIDSMTKVVDIEKELAKYVPIVQNYYRERRGLLTDNFKELKLVNAEQKRLIESDPSSVLDSGGNASSNIVVPDVKKNRTGKSDEEKAADKLKRQNESDLKKAQEEAKKSDELNKNLNATALESLRAYEDEKRKILLESREQAVLDEKIDFERKRNNLKVQNETIQYEIIAAQTEIEKLEKSKNETKSTEAKVEYNNAINSLQVANKKRESLQAANNSIMEQMQKTHQFNLEKIKVLWDGKDFERWINKENTRINASRRSDEDEINQINSLGEAKEKLQNLQYLKLTGTELKNLKSLEDAKRYLREEADRKMLAAQLASFELQKAKLVESINELSDGDAKDKLLADLEALEDRITQVKGSIKGGKDVDNKTVTEEGRAAMNDVDLLGFSATQWSDMFQNLKTTQGQLEILKAGVQALGNAFSMFNNLQNSLNQRDLNSFTKNQDKKKLALLKQLNQGFINQEEYHKGVQLLEEETDRKKSEIELKQAKMERAMAVSQIAINTASAIMSIWAQVPKFDFGISAGVLTGFVSALGVAQAATVLAQPLPSYAEGGFFEGYTGSSSFFKDETGERPVGLVKLHEKEWTAPRWMTQSPRLANTFEYLENVRKSKTIPMAEGGYINDNTSTTSSVSTPQNLETNTDYVEYIAVLSDVRELLQKLSDDGVMAYIIENAENGKKILRMVKSYEKIEQRASGK